MRKDVQKRRVYKWEDSIPLFAVGITGARACSMRRCRELVQQACTLYGLAAIEVRAPKNSRKTSATYTEHYIELPKHFQRKDVALHEVSHYIVGIYWPKSADHGAVFVRVYMHLLHELLGGDVKWMESWARFHNVSFAGSAKYAPG